MYKDPKNYKVLVIEDNPGDFALIEDYLQEYIASPETIQARTFKEAENYLSVLEKCPYDVILLDLSLPDGSGEKLIKDIVALNLDCPVIILTGSSNFEFSIKSLSMGISDYLIKDDLSPTSLYKSLVYNMERKRILHDLEESQSRYSHLFHMSPQPSWVLDLETLQFMDVNEATISHYGYSRKEFLSMNIKDILPAEELKTLKTHINASKLNQKPFYRIATHRKQNSELIKVEIKTNLIHFKSKVALLVLCSDITERLKYIHTIKEQNQQMKEIAWIQSHMVRAPIARLLGLVSLIDQDKAIDNDHKELLFHILESATELDQIVRNINTKATEM